jgi:hypothetical protein
MSRVQQRIEKLEASPLGRPVSKMSVPEAREAFHKLIDEVKAGTFPPARTPKEMAKSKKLFAASRLLKVKRHWFDPYFNTESLTPAEHIAYARHLLAAFKNGTDPSIGTVE